MVCCVVRYLSISRMKTSDGDGFNLIWRHQCKERSVSRYDKIVFQDNEVGANAEIRVWARSQYADLQEAISRERDWEDQQNRGRNERFE